jgi:hypothetical protein
MILTGRTSNFPLHGKLYYRFFGASNAEIGSGTFNVNGTAGQPATFNVPLTFNLPPRGGPIRLVIYDRNAEGLAIGSTSVDLNVWPPQDITIESPADGALVGSPAILAGKLARYPFEGMLRYRVLDATGSEIGTDSFAVAGTPGQPTTFSGAVTFNGPVDGGPIRVELFDQNPADGSKADSASINLLVAPVQQTIIIETPPPAQSFETR